MAAMELPTLSTGGIARHIKLLRIACFVAVSIALSQSVSGQGFANLNFEQGTILSSSPSGYGFDSGTANVPGWTEYYGYGETNYSGGMTILYNNLYLDSAGVAWEGTNFYLGTPAIQGNYSIFLQGGSLQYAYANPGVIATNGTSVGQTGQIPATAKTIIYWGDALQVTFNGQTLSFIDISNALNYTIWAADISAYAGQTGELLFKAPWPYGGGMLDNIQFSSLPVPEPSEFALVGLGGLLLGFHFWRMKRPKLRTGCSPTSTN